MHQLEHLDLTDEQVTAQIRQAYKKYTNLKNDKGQHDCWLAELIAAQAQNSNRTKKSIWKWIWSTK